MRFLVLCSALLFSPSDQPVANGTPATVPGLTMPGTLTPSPDDGFVLIQAECKGTVQFTAIGIGVPKFKYTKGGTANSLIVSVPPAGGTIIVTAVGVVDGKMTPFASTSITVPGNTNNTKPVVNPVVPKGTKLYVVALGSAPGGLDSAVSGTGAVYRNYAAGDPKIAEKNLTRYATNLPQLVVMDGTGKVLYHGSLSTVDGAIAVITGLVSK